MPLISLWIEACQGIVTNTDVVPDKVTSGQATDIHFWQQEVEEALTNSSSLPGTRPTALEIGQKTRGFQKTQDLPDASILVFLCTGSGHLASRSKRAKIYKGYHAPYKRPQSKYACG